VFSGRMCLLSHPQCLLSIHASTYARCSMFWHVLWVLLHASMRGGFKGIYDWCHVFDDYVTAIIITIDTCDVSVFRSCLALSLAIHSKPAISKTSPTTAAGPFSR
jgi:hypothetical protein